MRTAVRIESPASNGGSSPSTVTFIVGSQTFSAISLDRSKNRNINYRLRFTSTSQTVEIMVEKGFNHRLECRRVDIFASRTHSGENVWPSTITLHFDLASFRRSHP